MADVQKEHGFTSIANELLDAIALRKFNGTQFRLLLVIVRYTYGFQRKSHSFSLSFLHQQTGISKDSIKRAIKTLVDSKVLVVVTEPSFNRARELKINKDYDQWLIEKDEPKTPEIVQDDKSSTGGNSTPSTGDKTAPSTGGNFAPHINKEKENIKIKEEEHARGDPILDLLIKNNIISPGGITAVLYEDLEDIENKFGFDVPDSMIKEAIKDAVRGNGRTWKFVYNKLNLWRKQGIRTVADLRRLENNTVPFKPPQASYRSQEVLERWREKG